MDLLLIRHGLPVRISREENVAGDPADPPLAPDGHQQARLAAEWLRPEPIDAVYASPLRRAVETATPIAAALGTEMIIRDDLAEWDRDSEEYLHVEELRATNDPIWHALARSDLGALGIDVHAFRARVVGAIDAIAAEHPSQRVAVVCHGGVINTYTGDVIGLGTDRTLWFSPDYAGISNIKVSSSGIRSIATLNETQHLRAAAS
jgi:probable phosphoglycerate mutase